MEVGESLLLIRNFADAKSNICNKKHFIDMTGFNSYINGLDLSALKAYCIHHGRLMQYAVKKRTFLSESSGKIPLLLGRNT